MPDQGTSKRDHFIPFAEWKPDDMEFSPDSMELVRNFIPIFSGYRPTADLVVVSDGPLPADDGYSTEVSGEFTHRTSEDLGTDVVQPLLTLQVTHNIATVPGQKQFHSVVSGFFANDGEFGRAPAHADEEHAYIELVDSTRDWATGTNMDLRWRYRLDDVTDQTLNTQIEFIWGMLTTDGVIGGVGDTELGRTTLTDTWQNLRGVGGDWINHDEVELLANITEDRVYMAITVISLDPVDTNEYWPNETLEKKGWQEVGAGSLHAAMDKSGGADDDIYAESPGTTALLPEDAKKFQIRMNPDLNDSPDSDNEIRLRYEITDSDDIELTITVKESVEDQDDLVHFDFGGTIPLPKDPAPQDLAIPMTGWDASVVEDWDDIYLEVGFISTTGGGGGTPFVTQKPDIVPTNNLWGGFGGPDGTAEEKAALIADDSDLTGFSSGFGNENDSLIGKFSRVEKPEEPGTVVGRARMERRTAANADNGMQIVVGAGNREVGVEVIHDVDSPAEWFEVEVDSGLITDAEWELPVGVRVRNTSSPNSDVFEMELIAPGGGVIGKIMALAWAAPEKRFVDYSHMRGAVDLTIEVIPGDTIRQYYGTNTRIWEVDDPTTPWTDVSKAAGDPGDGNLGPPIDYNVDEGRSWSFTSFGDKLIATNHADHVQVKEINTQRFRNLIGFDSTGGPITDTGNGEDYVTRGGVKPKARFAATINSFLCLANINTDSYVDGRAYTFWNSAFGNPQEFYPADLDKQSSLFQIISRPGEITGLVGGEYGIMFKEDSIFRVEYVGLPTVFNFPEITNSQGCPYPRSIVRYKADTYFWGSGGIFVIRNGAQVQEIGRGKISKYVFDSLFEANSLVADPTTDERQNASYVIGAFDPYSGLIFWSYRNDGRDNFRNNGMIVYNPQKDQFTTIRPGYDLFTTSVLSIGNRQQQIDSTARSLFFIRNEPRSPSNNNNHLQLERFSESSTMIGVMETNTIPAASFPDVDRGTEIELLSVRPIYRYEVDQGEPFIWIDIRAGQSPIIEETERKVSVNNDESRADGYIPITEPISGEWWQFDVYLQERGIIQAANATASTAQFPAQRDFQPDLGAEEGPPATKELLGLQVEYLIRGVI